MMGPGFFAAAFAESFKKFLYVVVALVVGAFLLGVLVAWKL